MNSGLREQNWQDEELKKAYSEMLEGCLQHPDQWDRYAIWMIEKTDGTHIGDHCFKGLRENGIAENGVGGNTPVIIKYPLRQMTNDNENAVCACLNCSQACCPQQIEDRSIVINDDSGEAELKW